MSRLVVFLFPPIYTFCNKCKLCNGWHWKIILNLGIDWARGLTKGCLSEHKLGLESIFRFRVKLRNMYLPSRVARMFYGTKFSTVDFSAIFLDLIWRHSFVLPWLWGRVIVVWHTTTGDMRLLWLTACVSSWKWPPRCLLGKRYLFIYLFYFVIMRFVKVYTEVSLFVRSDQSFLFFSFVHETSTLYADPHMG